MTVPKLSALNCPNCGAAIELRTFGQAVTVVCQNCKSILDANDPNVAILRQAQSFEPLIPLGSRGQFEGVKFEAIGFQVRTEHDPESGPDSWNEFLLYNPYRGYRYLTEYSGHWNFVHIAHSVPEPVSNVQVRMGGQPFQLYARAVAETTYVVGEFPWVVRVGDKANVEDYISAPRILSAEMTEDETVWSISGYLSGADVWQAFGLPGAPPQAIGIAPNQPSPFARGVGLWGTAWKLALACLAMLFWFYGVSTDEIYRQNVSLASGAQVTPVFSVGGHKSNLELKTVNLGSDSFYMHYALVDQASGQAVSFARDVGKEDRADVPSIAPGRYAVRMESEPPGARFELTVRRDVPSLGIFGLVFILLFIPPLLQTMRRSSFETQRWQGSSR